MIWSILFAGVLLFFVKKNWSEFRGEGAGLVFLFVLLTVFGVLLSLVMTLFMPCAWQELETVSLVNVKKGNDQDLFLLTAEVQNRKYYIYYKEDETWYEKVKIQKTRGVEVDVVEVSGCPAKVTIFKSQFASNWLWLIAFDVDKTVKYEFSIPKGGIKKQFEF